MSHHLFDQLESPYKEFYEFHGVQLIGINFPGDISFLHQLYDKLKGQIYDSGEYFQIVEDQNNEKFEVALLKNLNKNERIFLVDHALSFRYPDLRNSLASNPSIVPRLKNMLKYWNKKIDLNYVKPIETPDFVKEFDYLNIEDPRQIEVKENCVTLSLYGNKINNDEYLWPVLDKLKQLKAFWINENPIDEKYDDLKRIIEEKYPNIEIFNSKYTKNAGEWAFKYTTYKGDFKKMNEIKLEEMRYFNFESRDIFSVNDKSIFSKFKKAKKIDFTGNTITTLPETNKLFDILKVLPSIKEILVDNYIMEILWDLKEYGKLSEINKSLKKINGFCLNYERPNKNQEEIEFIMQNIWKISNTYRLANSNQLDESSVWYIMDELGSAIPHSNSPNCMVVPFLYAPNNKMDESLISYTLMWPCQDLIQGDFISRDYLFGLDESKFRSARIGCWFNIDQYYFLNIFETYKKKVIDFTLSSQVKLFNLFQNVAYQKKLSEILPLGILPEKRPLNVVSDLELLNQNLKREEFKIVNNLEEADIIFLNANIKENFSKISKNKFVNQFPYESCIVMKHHLAQTVYDSLGEVSWLQETFDLGSQLPEFLGSYYEKEKKLKNNLWIIKPPNMARSIDMIVTNNIDVILRCLETGPKLAQKYIERPLTLRGKKIDLRFIVLVRSINPLEIFLYNVFWIRTSNNNFSLDPRSLEIYETHFTVMNYGKQLTQIHYPQFIKEFNEENKGIIEWESVHSKIKILIKELFACVAIKHPEMHVENARAIYGMDIMIDKRNYQPKLLEMTFSPDCGRACKYHPSFYDDLFACLFLHKDDTNVERII